MSGTIHIRDKTFTVLYGENQIAEATARVAARINRELAGKTPVFVAVLNGAFMFAADLLRKVRIPCEVSFIKLRSYENMASSGQVKSVMGLDTDVTGRTVVIVEDIVDSGLTLEYLTGFMREKSVADLRVATLLFKPSKYRRATPPDYVGLEVPDRFVVGYGMDYSGEGRQLKDIHVLA